MLVSLPCTDPDWDGTVTEQTDKHLSVRLQLWSSYIYVDLCIYLI